MFNKLFSTQKTVIDERKIEELLTRGVEEVFIKESLEKRLRSGKPLRVKLGIDPTGKHIHLGHAVILWKLKAFQDLGHHVVLIVGDFTAVIGDPSDKLEKRPLLTQREVADNLTSYKQQLGKIIDLKRATVYYNSSWLSKLKFDEVARLAESFSVQQMSNRRNFKERLDSGSEVSLREFLYPLMQGYDSVMSGADVELGGFDQLFNLKAGRIIQRHYNVPEQDILTGAMLVGTDGRKMSKSWGNVINITDKPDEMFGKIMSLRDDLIQTYFLLATDMLQPEIDEISNRLEKGENPRDVKLNLAEKITARYWGQTAAQKARKNFIETFSEKKIPEDVQTVEVDPNTLFADVLLKNDLIKSKSEWKRLVAGKGITDAETGVAIVDEYSSVQKNITLRVGKRRFLKIILRS